MDPGETTKSDQPESAGSSAPVGTPQASWQFVGGASGKSSAKSNAPSEGFAWSAPEYFQHQKSVLWYLGLAMAILLITALVYLITRDTIPVIVVSLTGVTFGIFGLHKPQVLDCAVDEKGIYIGQKFYPYNFFRSFSLLQEDTARSIFLVPQRRFSLPLSLYYSPADENTIVNIIGSHLPHEERAVPPVDQFMSKIHF